MARRAGDDTARRSAACGGAAMGALAARAEDGDDGDGDGRRRPRALANPAGAADAATAEGAFFALAACCFSFLPALRSVTLNLSTAATTASDLRLSLASASIAALDAAWRSSATLRCVTKRRMEE